MPCENSRLVPVKSSLVPHLQLNNPSRFYFIYTKQASEKPHSSSLKSDRGDSIGTLVRKYLKIFLKLHLQMIIIRDLS